MISGTLIETSGILNLLKKLCFGYYSIEQRVDEIYKNSRTHRLAERLCYWIKVCFSESFLGRIIDIDIAEKDNLVILKNSRFVKWLLRLYRTWENKVRIYLETSATVNLTKEAKKELYFLPVKTFGIIVVTAVPINIFIAIVLNKEIGLLGWAIRGLLLFVGLGGLFCNATWEDIKRTNFFIRKGLIG